MGKGWGQQHYHEIIFYHDDAMKQTEVIKNCENEREVVKIRA